MAKPDKTQQLSIEQLNAIDLLVMGHTDREVAEAVGVNRSTVTSWRLYNPDFIATLNRRRKEVWGAAADRLRKLLLKAMDVLEQALDSGDASIAMQLVKIAQISVVPTGETEREDVLQKMADTVRSRQLSSYFLRGTSFGNTDLSDVEVELLAKARELEALG